MTEHASASGGRLPPTPAEAVEQARRQVDRLCWTGILLGLAFTMTNVQGFAANGARLWSLPWLAAWLLDPMVSLVLLAILRAEQVTARYGIHTGGWVRGAKWFTLAATYVMNTWAAFAARSADMVVLHSVPPLVVFVAAEAVTDLRDKLSEAVRTAAVNATEQTPQRTDKTAGALSGPALPQVNRRVSFEEYLSRADSMAAGCDRDARLDTGSHRVLARTVLPAVRHAHIRDRERGAVMSTHDQPSPAQSREVAPHIFEAELIEDTPPTPTLTHWQRFMNWWQRSSRIPAALKSRRTAKQTAMDSAVFMLRSPWRLLTAAGRGLVAAARGWRRWIRVLDYREAAEQSEKLADKFTEIRQLTLFRWKVTGAVVVAAAVALAVADLLYGTAALWVAGGLASIALAILGRHKDGSPGRKPVLAGPRALTWTMDPQVLVDAFRDAKLIGKDESLRLVERAAHDGAGWAVTVDLPATRKAVDVLKHRDALSSALAVDELQLIVERVRGRGGHAGRVFLWVADDDPYAGAPLRFPLLDVESWDAWRPISFGRDARQRKVNLQVVWTSVLIGAIPRQGKTCATRLPAAGLILDPYAQLYVFDGKGGKDWRAAEAIAHRFVCGDELEHIEAVRDYLAELVAEVQSRFARMSTLDDELCPESKITPEISRNPSLGMPITAVIIDEVQVYLECAERCEVGGKKTTLGAHIADLLTYLVRKGPAAGIVVILATQRPDSTTIPSRLRAVLGSRFALRVMDWRDSNIVLGEQMNTRGYDASTLLPSHKGVGILRPDGESDAGADTLAVTVRTYYMDNAAWRTICDRGRALRESAGTLTGHAAGDDRPREIDQAAVVKALGAASVESGAVADYSSVGLPEPLKSVVDYLAEAIDEREFVPTAELTGALDVEPSAFARDMAELECRPTRNYITTADGSTRRVRGYLTADIRAAVERAMVDEISSRGGEVAEPS